jgi:hypothetical protein
LDIGQDISIGYFLHRRPVRIGCAAFHIVNRLARELEWNAQFDKRFDIALAGLDPIARRLDLVEVTGADSREFETLRAQHIHDPPRR